MSNECIITIICKGDGKIEVNAKNNGVHPLKIVKALQDMEGLYIDECSVPKSRNEKSSSASSELAEFLADLFGKENRTMKGHGFFTLDELLEMIKNPTAEKAASAKSATPGSEAAAGDSSEKQDAETKVKEQA